MKRISIERYERPDIWVSGCIEGETDGGERWYMYLSPKGKPYIFYPNDEAASAGRPIHLEEPPYRIWSGGLEE